MDHSSLNTFFSNLTSILIFIFCWDIKKTWNFIHATFKLRCCNDECKMIIGFSATWIFLWIQKYSRFSISTQNRCTPPAYHWNILYVLIFFFNGSKEKNILSWYFPPASLLSSSHQNQRFSLIADYLSSLSDDWWSSHVNQDVANLPDCLHTCSFVNLNFVTDHKFWIENPSGDETFEM